MAVAAQVVTGGNRHQRAQPSALVRAKVPLRMSFAGGGTDVPPYPQTHGGAVLCAGIDKYAYASLMPVPDVGEFVVESLDYDVVAKYRADEDLVFDGKLDLVKAALKRLEVDRRAGLKLFLHTDAPPGSGLGSSSAVAVAIIGVLAQWYGKPLTEYDIAHLAVVIERGDLGIKGGLQDQYACTFGGFNFIEFLGNTVVVNPLRIKAEVVNELHYRLLLCYTGMTRLSAGILDRQIAGYTRGEAEVLAALAELKAITVDMKNALLRGQLDRVGELLHAGWENKKRLASGITNAHLDELYAAARRAGALGGKVLGAGGGGYLLLYCPFTRRHTVARAVEACGAQPVAFSFEPRGLQVWQAASE